ncbi:MAG TPA: HemK/PrmC family methyltransferase, partial [Actinomycetota bacterium]|nr:HemK/PrmC family methyltransferase [Actinomycetota bacterium]
DAKELLALAARTSVHDLNSHDRRSPRVRERYLSFIARRAGGEPLPFITGRIQFRDLDLEVRPGAFVPRPSSELLVARAVRRLRGRRAPVVIDVCTGAGPIALALAHEIPEADVWGTDISSAGLAQARRNAKRYGLDNVRFRNSDMYERIPKKLVGSVDAIVGHVPYVPPDELNDLPAEVKDHEPVYTLTGQSADGLELVRRATTEGFRFLKPGGWLLLEISDDLAPRVRRICKTAGYEDKGMHTDRYKLSAIVEARRSISGRARPAR